MYVCMHLFAVLIAGYLWITFVGQVDCVIYILKAHLQIINFNFY